jgi:hypothetical protein
VAVEPTQAGQGGGDAQPWRPEDLGRDARSHFCAFADHDVRSPTPHGVEQGWQRRGRVDATEDLSTDQCLDLGLGDLLHACEHRDSLRVVSREATERVTFEAEVGDLGLALLGCRDCDGVAGGTHGLDHRHQRHQVAGARRGGEQHPQTGGHGFGPGDSRYQRPSTVWNRNGPRSRRCTRRGRSVRSSRLRCRSRSTRTRRRERRAP